MITLTAGPKLRQQAIERTKRHIARQCRKGTELSRALSCTQGGIRFGMDDYIDVERTILRKLENGQ